MEHTLRTMAAVVAASAVACLPSCHGNERSAQTDAPQVDVASVIEDSVVIYKDYPGTLTAVNSVDVVGRVNGYLRSQNYTDGSTVGKGALLFTIEDAQYRDAVSNRSPLFRRCRPGCSYA